MADELSLPLFHRKRPGRSQTLSWTSYPERRRRSGASLSFIAKADLAGLAGQRYHDELVVKSRRINQANRTNLKIEQGRASSKKAKNAEEAGERLKWGFAETRGRSRPSRANPKMAEGRRTSGEFQECRAEMSQLEGTDTPRRFGRRSENKRNDKSRDLLKREGYREIKHEKRIEVDKGDIEMM
jgi:hypothetical protein